MTHARIKLATDAQESTAFDLARLKIRTIGPGVPVPKDIFELRREVYGLETGFLDDNALISDNDAKGTHIALYYDEGAGDELIAATHLVDAEICDFAAYSGLPQETLSRGFYSSRSIVRKRYRKLSLFPLLLYLAGREYRMRGRDLMFAYMNPGDTPGRRILRYSLIETLPPRTVHGRGGATYEVVAAWQDLAYCLHRSYETMSSDLKAYLAQSGLLADEIEQTVRGRIQNFYKGPWFDCLYAGTLTREQYIATLANMHQFVRWTTRILGKLVGQTSDRGLRGHYVAHLDGEVDHDVMLEQDLEALGADVDYVVNHMVPIAPIQEFMAAQESLAAFRQDPVLFLAIPFSIEGLSGHAPKGFGPALARNIAGWGLDPRQVTSFLTSHVHTDGGEDGHWEMSRKMIRAHVKSETDVQRFLTVVQGVMNALDRAYAAYAAIPVFSLTAADQDKEGTITPAA